MDIAAIVIFLVVAYFLVAAFVPRLRMRWGVSYGWKTTVLKPHMGMVTCIGMALFFAAIALQMILAKPPDWWMERVVVPAFVIVAFGAVLDRFREPTITRRKR
jgi:uncharacterized membrane protein